mgnify:FL=1
MKKNGFTLIELLIVIAIIGILSSVVLASLNTARGKGANAAVKSNLNNIRAQAELVYDNNGGSYTSAQDICTETTIAKATEAARVASGAASVVNVVGTAQTSTTVNCHSATGAWAISSPLKVTEGTSVYWCVDSQGTSVGRVNLLGGGATVCPAS